MRKIFSQRARMVVYLENEAIDRMLQRARGEGKTLVEWARETLLGELATMEELSRAEPVRVARRRTIAHNGLGGSQGIDGVASSANNLDSPVADAESGTRKGAPKTCEHGIAKGWRCWQCGGIAVIE